MSREALEALSTVEEMQARIQETMRRMEEDPEFAQELREGKPSGNPIQLGPRLPDAKTWADLQVEGSKNNAKKWLDRTTHPKKNFKEEALKSESKDRYKDSMTKVLEEDLWAGGMELVDVDETIKTIQARGDGVYSKGVEDRRAKIERRVAELHDARLALCHEVDRMDTSTDEAREKKMVENLRGLKAIGKARRGAS